jgi:hypothetical protein
VSFFCRIHPVPDLTASERFPAPLPQLLADTALLEQILDFKSVTRKSERSEKRVKFKKELKRAYGDVHNGNLFDMATGTYLPCDDVCASHIFQHRWGKFLPIFTKLENINDVHNGLFLYKPVEVAFDDAQISIRAKNGKIRFHLLDEDIRHVTLLNRAVELRRNAKVDKELQEEELLLGSLTFGDLDGQELHFPPGMTIRPSKRLLAIYAYASWREAKKKGYTSASTPDVSISDDASTRACLSHFSR